MTNRAKSEFTSHCWIAAKMNFLMLLLFPARFAHARYWSRMIDRFLNWGNHGKSKSGKIKGRCQPPPAFHSSWRVWLRYSLYGFGKSFKSLQFVTEVISLISANAVDGSLLVSSILTRWISRGSTIGVSNPAFRPFFSSQSCHPIFSFNFNFNFIHSLSIYYYTIASTRV